MKRLVLVGLLFLAAVHAYGQACTWYVANARLGTFTCLSAANACLWTDLYPKNPQGPDVICEVGTDSLSNAAGEGHYTGLNSMISPPHPPAPTLTALATGGTMSAGLKALAYTYVTNGVESSLSFQSSPQFWPDPGGGRVTVSGISLGPPGTTARILYMQKERRLGFYVSGAPNPPGEWHKLPVTIQAIFADNITTGATINPGPDSGWTAIQWPVGFSGSPANHLTIRALNVPVAGGAYENGTVLHDGQGSNAPIYMQNGNRYIDFIGIDACCAPKSPMTPVFRIGPGSGDIKRTNLVIFKAQPDYNVMVVEDGSDGNYGISANVELNDCALFGPGRKQYQFIGDLGPYTVRRCAYVDTQSNNIGPKPGMSGLYNSYGGLFVDSVGLAPKELQQTHRLMMSGQECVYPCSVVPCSPSPGCGSLYSGFTVDQPYSLFGADALYPGQTHAAELKIAGHVNMVRAGDRIDPTMLGVTFINAIAHVTIKDSVNATAQAFKPFYFADCAPAADCPGTIANTATRLTSIGGLANSFSPQWVTSDILALADKSTFDYVARGICYQHRDDLTVDLTKPRFPFPLKARMMRYMTWAGQTPIDVDAQFIANLGPIPAACSAAPGVTPTATFTNTPTYTPSATPTYTPSRTPSNTATPTPTYTPSYTPSRTPTNTYTPSNTPSYTPSNTPTFTPSYTPSNTPTLTPTGNPTATDTPTPTATYTPSNTATYTPSYTPSATPTYTPSATPTYTPSQTPTPTYTPTVTPGATLSTVFEAESCIAVAPVRVVADGNASGSAYVDTTVSGVADPNAGGTLTCPFAVPAGTYFVWVRMMAPSASQQSYYVSLDGEAVTNATHIFDMGQNIDCLTNQPDQPDIGPSYFWSLLKDRTTNCFATGVSNYARLPVLTAGPHTLTFFGREVGARLDKFILTTSETFDPRSIQQRRSGPRPLRLKATPTPKPTPP